ncbi:MAG: phosphotriesterase-related protein [SAR202 cluster bacterium]|nr:phosphotriesterase-related protein [SAR202 cluster bacterium]
MFTNKDNSDSNSKFVQTVLGKINPSDVGPTTTHEHILIDFVCMFNPPSEASERFKAFQPVTMENLGWVRYDHFRNQDNLLLADENVAVEELLLFKGHGGRSIIDATTIGIGRDPYALSRIARLTGINIIMGAGYYVDSVHPHNMDKKNINDIADEITNEIKIGVGDTGIKCGIIGEIGCSWPLTKNEHKVLEASAIAQSQTGASILIHPGRNEKSPFEIIKILSEAGADLSRVVMGHIERTIQDHDTLLELAKLGTYLEYDLFGWESSYYPLSHLDMVSDGARIDFIQFLINNGYSERIVTGQDVFCKSRLAKYGGHGYHHIMENMIPRMREKNISEPDIHNLIIKNPTEILTIKTN